MLYLEESPHLEFDPPPPFTLSPDPPSTSNVGESFRIVELGSGTGIVGLKLAEHLAQMRTGATIDQVADSRGSTCKSDLILLTDLDDVCPLLEENLDGRRAQIYRGVRGGLGDAPYVAVEVRPLAWGNYQHASAIIDEMRGKYLDMDHSTSPLTHIVCSDLVGSSRMPSLAHLLATLTNMWLKQVYFPELLAPLLRTLLHLTSPPLSPSPASDTPTIIISYKIRSLSKETPFWSAFGLWFAFEPVLARPIARGSAGAGNSVHNLESVNDDASVEHKLQGQDGWRRFGEPDSDDGDGDAMFVFVAKRKPESFEWQIPDDDKFLLEGIGTRGTGNSKGDDSFEVMLLMGMNG